MAGTIAGGKRAAKKNLAKDPNFYKRIGAIGGSKNAPGGFGTEKVGKDGLTGSQRASKYGAIGGRISRRKKARLAP